MTLYLDVIVIENVLRRLMLNIIYILWSSNERSISTAPSEPRVPIDGWAIPYVFLCLAHLVILSKWAGYAILDDLKFDTDRPLEVNTGRSCGIFTYLREYLKNLD